MVQSVFLTGQQRQDQSVPLSITEVVAGLWRPTDTERGDGAIDSEDPLCEGDFGCVLVQVIDSTVKEGCFTLSVCVVIVTSSARGVLAGRWERSRRLRDVCTEYMLGAVVDSFLFFQSSVEL